MATTMTTHCRQQADPAQVRQALTEAEGICSQRGVRLTALRRRVLEIIWNSTAPQGAYAILDELQKDGRRGAPPTVYRALDFLLEQGLIHRLASLNAFIGCRHPRQSHQGQFLICRKCGKVSEMYNPAIEQTIRTEAARQGFSVCAQMVEILGECPHCAGC